MQIMQKPPPAAFPPAAHVPARFLALFLLIIGLYSCAAANSSSGEPEAAVKTPLAQGGNITWIESGQNVYEVHTFTATGGTQTNAGQGFAALFSFIPSAAVTADVLVVAGGGGGGGTAALYGGGGGGGGGVVASANVLFGSVTYQVAVGKGGAGGAGNFPPGSVAASAANSNGPYSVSDGKNGGDSWIQIAALASAVGGGGGAKTYMYISPQDGTGKSGGSGGGGTYQGGGGKGTPLQGNAGASATGARAAAGGGGAGGAAVDATQYKTTAGGKGLANSITGTATFYGGGGAGGKTNTNAANGYPASSASGGLGGGGESGQPGIDGTGGGGGGGNGDGNTTADFVKRIGGKGGDGIVIIRFPYLSP